MKHTTTPDAYEKKPEHLRYFSMVMLFCLSIFFFCFVVDKPHLPMFNLHHYDNWPTSQAKTKPASNVCNENVHSRNITDSLCNGLFFFFGSVVRLTRCSVFPLPNETKTNSNSFSPIKRTLVERKKVGSSKRSVRLEHRKQQSLSYKIGFAQLIIIVFLLIVTFFSKQFLFFYPFHFLEIFFFCFILKKTIIIVHCKGCYFVLFSLP